MCDNCGCGTIESFTIIPMLAHHEHSREHGGVLHDHDHGRSHANGDVQHEHHHDHEHSHHHPHDHHHHTVPVHLPLLAKNDRLAERNRGFLKAKGLYAVNIVSSPGSGKTTLIAKTLELAADTLPVAVIVGDLETANDAARLRGKGAPVVQVTTGTVCHLDAEMIGHALEHLDLEGRRLLIIENVGNLVCPASYDLGEALRVVLISVTEGEDKPLKYPPIFHGAGVVIVSKTDMLPASGLDLEALRRNIRAVAPEAEIVEVSARTGEGMDEWISMLNRFAKNWPVFGKICPEGSQYVVG
jgi:hydrogenase nickel incorporation protein HypB